SMRPELDPKVTETVIDLARRAKTAARRIAHLSTDDKNQALQVIADLLAGQQDQILAANRRDLQAARTLVQSGRMTEALYHRLELDNKKFAGIIAGVKQIQALADPVGRTTLENEIAQNLRLYRVTCPIGVIAVIFESRPDALVQISALALKSSNAVLLKGG